MTVTIEADRIVIERAGDDAGPEDDNGAAPESDLDPDSFDT